MKDSATGQFNGVGVSIVPLGGVNEPSFRTIAVENKLFDTKTIKENSARTANRRRLEMLQNQQTQMNSINNSPVFTAQGQLLQDNTATTLNSFDGLGAGLGAGLGTGLGASLGNAFTSTGISANTFTSGPTKPPTTKFHDQQSLLAMVSEQISKLEQPSTLTGGNSNIGSQTNFEVFPVNKMPFTGPASAWDIKPKLPTNIDLNLPPSPTQATLSGKVDLPPPPFDSFQDQGSTNTLVGQGSLNTFQGQRSMSSFQDSMTSFQGQGNSNSFQGQGSPLSSFQGQGSSNMFQDLGSSNLHQGQGSPSNSFQGQGSPSNSFQDPGSLHMFQDQGSQPSSFLGQGSQTSSFKGQGSPSNAFQGQGSSMQSFDTMSSGNKMLQNTQDVLSAQVRQQTIDPSLLTYDPVIGGDIFPAAQPSSPQGMINTLTDRSMVTEPPRTVNSGLDFVTNQQLNPTTPGPNIFGAGITQLPITEPSFLFDPITVAPAPASNFDLGLPPIFPDATGSRFDISNSFDQLPSNNIPATFDSIPQNAIKPKINESQLPAHLMPAPTTQRPLVDSTLSTRQTVLTTTPPLYKDMSTTPGTPPIKYDMSPFTNDTNWAIFDPTSLPSNFSDFGPIIELPIERGVSFKSANEVGFESVFSPGSDPTASNQQGAQLSGTGAPSVDTPTNNINVANTNQVQYSTWSSDNNVNMDTQGNTLDSTLGSQPQAKVDLPLPPPLP
ncbi:hypothetical protein ACF0H5_015208 [Mactra antiquata]